MCSQEKNLDYKKINSSPNQSNLKIVEGLFWFPYTYKLKTNIN